MKKIDSLDALNGFYDAVDRMEVADARRSTPLTRPWGGFRGEVLKVAVACVVGVGIALAVILPVHTQPKVSTESGGTWLIDEQLVKSGYDNQNTLEPSNRRSRNEGGNLCDALAS